MGAGQSRESPNFQSGVYVTPQLVAQLQGKLTRQKPPLSQNSPSGDLLRPSIGEAVQNRVRQNPELRQALEESKLEGELLLKAEGEELRRVKEYADELMRKEYRVPTSKPPCLSEREEVTECYRSNTKDPLQCASLVDAYASCADQARRTVSASKQAVS